MASWGCRLLRQDLVASLNASVLQFSEAGGVRSLRRANDRGGRFAARGPGGRDEVMLFVYRNVSIEAVRFARHAGAFFQVRVPTSFPSKAVHTISLDRTGLSFL